MQRLLNACFGPNPVLHTGDGLPSVQGCWGFSHRPLPSQGPLLQHQVQLLHQGHLKTLPRDCNCPQRLPSKVLHSVAPKYHLSEVWVVAPWTTAHSSSGSNSSTRLWCGKQSQVSHSCLLHLSAAPRNHSFQGEALPHPLGIFITLHNLSSPGEIAAGHSGLHPTFPKPARHKSCIQNDLVDL